MARARARAKDKYPFLIEQSTLCIAFFGDIRAGQGSIKTERFKTRSKTRLKTRFKTRSNIRSKTRS